MKLFVIWSELWSLILGVSMAWCLNVAALVAGFEGIKNSFGLYWAVAAAATLFCRQPPIAFVGGAFIHSMNSWKWHPAIAIPFAIRPYIWMLSLACLHRLSVYIRRFASPH